MVLELSKNDRMVVVDPDIRLVGGWATVAIRDSQGDYVPVEEVEKALYRLANSMGQIPLLYEHGNKPVGRIVRWERRVHPETGKDGIYIEAVIFKSHPLADRVWEMVKSGVLRGFSIAGIASRVKSVNEDGEEVNIAKDLDLYEISIVREPANPEARVTYVNEMAKSAEISKESCPRGRYTDGRYWKKMTCPGDTSGRKRPICGCIRYFMNCYYDGDLVRAVKKCLDLFSGNVEGNPEAGETKKHNSDTATHPTGDGGSMPEVESVTPESEEYEVEKAFATEELAKESCKDKYFVCTRKEDGKCVRGHFKTMKCPDGHGPNRFCGCVKYQVDCNGKSLEQAKAICFKICVDKYGKEYCTRAHGSYVKKSGDAPAPTGDGVVDGVSEESVEKTQAPTGADEPESTEEVRESKPGDPESAREREARERVSEGSDVLRVLDEIRASIARLTEQVTELSQRLTSVEKSVSERREPVEKGSGPVVRPEDIEAIVEGKAGAMDVMKRAGIKDVSPVPPPVVASTPPEVEGKPDVRGAVEKVLEGKTVWEVLHGG